MVPRYDKSKEINLGPPHSATTHVIVNGIHEYGTPVNFPNRVIGREYMSGTAIPNGFNTIMHLKPFSPIITMWTVGGKEVPWGSFPMSAPPDGIEPVASRLIQATGILDKLSSVPRWLRLNDFKSRMDEDVYARLVSDVEKWDPRGMLNQGFSLPVFLIELPELLTTVGLVRRLINETPHSLLKQARNKGFRSAMHYFAREVARGHLAYSFGIQPFLNDVHKFMSILVNWRKWADELCRQDKLHVHTSLILPKDEYANVFPLGTFSYHGNASFSASVGVRILGWRTNVVWHPLLPELSRILSRIAQFTDCMGLNGDLSIIWEKVPFSFVVDWFYNVGDFLQKSRRSNYRFQPIIDGTYVTMDGRLYIQLDTIVRDMYPPFVPGTNLPPTQAVLHPCRARIDFASIYTRQDLPSLASHIGKGTSYAGKGLDLHRTTLCASLALTSSNRKVPLKSRRNKWERFLKKHSRYLCATPWWKSRVGI